MNLPLRLFAEFQAQVGTQPDWTISVEGREMWGMAISGTDGVFKVFAPDVGGRVVFDSRSARQGRTLTRRPLPSWSHYVVGAYLALLEEAVPPTGGQFVIVGDEPAGPRYDHALGMAFASLCDIMNGKTRSLRQLLELLEGV